MRVGMIRAIPFMLALAGGGIASMAMAAPASAHVGDVTISCTAVTFNYSVFPADVTNVITSEVVTVNGYTVASKSFSFDGVSGTDTIAIHLPAGTFSVTGTATWTQRGKVNSATLTETVSGCAPPCDHHHNPPPPPPCDHHHHCEPPCHHRH
jgi:hypothetical protein